jgi:hypothetical protein
MSEQRPEPSYEAMRAARRQQNGKGPPRRHDRAIDKYTHEDIENARRRTEAAAQSRARDWNPHDLFPR